MSQKTNSFLKKIDDKYQREYRIKFAMLQQMGLDAACIAAAEVFHMGATRAKEFCNAYLEAIQEMAQITATDGETDRDIEYAKHTIDKRIKAIVGAETFLPWEERYG